MMWVGWGLKAWLLKCKRGVGMKMVRIWEEKGMSDVGVGILKWVGLT